MSTLKQIKKDIRGMRSTFGDSDEFLEIISLTIYHLQKEWTAQELDKISDDIVADFAKERGL